MNKIPKYFFLINWFESRRQLVMEELGVDIVFNEFSNGVRFLKSATLLNKAHLNVGTIIHRHKNVGPIFNHLLLELFCSALEVSLNSKLDDHKIVVHP